MEHASLDDFLAREGKALRSGPSLFVFDEDGVELESTLRHHLAIGFRTLLVFGEPRAPLAPDLTARVHRIRHDIHADDAVPQAVNRLIAAAPGVWMAYLYNAEYLFFPFCETRRVGEMLAFHAEERRDAMLTYVIDLYAEDLERHPDAVSRDAAMLDRSGYYALGREDPENGYARKERQIDVYGGLRWRFEEHVPYERRRIDRIGLFRAAPGLTLLGDHRFNVEEYNTYACPWHHNLTAAICSFRTAKALKSNPGPREAIGSFRWQNSVPFDWTSAQLLELGLIEPGQWF
ncbi:MAG: hypothetical protein KGN33_01880 [Paracoccaceae bacterium]|nr:hypothetical protein [Paracoccaceae bacterium]